MNEAPSDHAVTWYPLEWTDRVGRLHVLDYADADKRLDDAYLLGMLFECVSVRMLAAVTIEVDAKALARFVERSTKLRTTAVVEAAQRRLLA